VTTREGGVGVRYYDTAWQGSVGIVGIKRSKPADLMGEASGLVRFLRSNTLTR
jgi:hypothetical protein